VIFGIIQLLFDSHLVVTSDELISIGLFSKISQICPEDRFFD
jgi:hypothetical protein